MDFSLEYTESQEKFAREVRAWLKANAPRNLPTPANPAELTLEEHRKRREFGRKLGEKGWLAPTFPKEYGGGGLTIDESVVLERELDEYDLTIPPYYDVGTRLAAPAIAVWGTDDQKERLLKPILRGEIIVWQLFTEPEAGSDLAGLKTTALRDGDYYVINGQKIFVGAIHNVDQFWLLACTDPKGTRHRNLSMFLVPAKLPGISIAPLDLIAAGGESGTSAGQKNSIFLDNVRVPQTYLIGRENDGWGVANSTLEIEHGGAGSVTRNRVVEGFLDYCRENKDVAHRLAQEPELKQVLAEVFIGAEVLRLFGMRNYWVRHAKRKRSYEGNQYSYYNKMWGIRLSYHILKVLGPIALSNDPQWGPVKGILEQQQRAGMITAPGGSPEVQKLQMARRIGIGRSTKEEAAAAV
ncbi:MAG: acyl-CoA dehydrogenase family protein [Chloroflexota bacterium]|nr:acyl-CoA dehydrogenase family protein [Chloroflexota bacterium]